MNKQELNRDIKRLWKRWEDNKTSTEFNNEMDEWDAYDKRELILKKEFKRLWNADPEKTLIKVEQLKMLLIMNTSMRVITLHSMTFKWIVK